MHEIKLMEDVVKILDKQVDDPEVGDVKTVYLEVGELRYIVPEIMTTGFKCLPKSRKLDNARLDIKVLPVRIRCVDCGKEQEVKDNVYKCSGCSSVRAERIAGDEFIVKGIEW